MKKYEIKNTIICGDSLKVLKTIPDESIDCVITSPPYFNLRDYVEGQIGLESTYQEYIGKLIDIFNEVKRVLKKEGTCFVNLGDTFAGGGFGYENISDEEFIKKYPKQSSNKGTQSGKSRKLINNLRKNNKQFSQKSLMMIPERFGIAMIDEGWILRNKLVWIKRNAMPESVQDRWKKAHEYIFFFVKNKSYNFNLDSIRTPHKDISIKRAEYEQGRNVLGQNPSSVGEKYNRDKKNKDGTEKYYSMPARQVKLNPKGAVPPDFLDINTNCRADDIVEHYATYPQDLINPLIKAGCPEGGIILDPFGGSGTTAVAAKKLNRNFILIELNKNYCEIAEKRIAVIPQTLFTPENQQNSPK